MKETKEMTTYELISELTRIDHEIDMLCLIYEKVRLELIRRYPQAANQEEFKPKEKKL